MNFLAAVKSSVLSGLTVFSFFSAAAQQLKLGDNPSVVNKSALLELNSSNQGLLLPRVLKSEILSGGKLFAAADGMLVFVNDAAEKSLYIKRNGAWEKVGDITSTTLTGAITGTGTGTLATTITNGAVTYNKIQPIGGSSLLGRYNTTAGIAEEIKPGTGLLLNNTTGFLSADNTNNLWNANKIQHRDIDGKAPAMGEVLKWNATTSKWEPALDASGGASYGVLGSNDIGQADSPDPYGKMKIWASSGTGTVVNGPLGMGAWAWNVLSFRGTSFTTQLYFDKNTLALKEWGNAALPFVDNATNPWYKLVTTHGNNAFTDGGLVFAGKTSDATSEVRQDAARLFWNNTDKRLGVGTNDPNSTLHVEGSIAHKLTISTSGTSIDLDASMNVLVVRRTGGGSQSAVNVYLPLAGTCPGREYTIIREYTGTATGSVVARTAAGDPGFTGAPVTFTSNTIFKVISIGTRWVPSVRSTY